MLITLIYWKWYLEISEYAKVDFPLSIADSQMGVTNIVKNNR